MLVVGDLMLDRYLWGKVERISPEAPVPIVDIAREESRPGGAANVALNLHALGTQVVMCGLVGVDTAGAELIGHAKTQGFDASTVVQSASRKTTVKVRIMGNQQQVLRVDREDRFQLNEEESAKLLAGFLTQLPTCHALILQDYDKGLLHPELIDRMIQAAESHNIPVIVDPKFRNFFAYKGCTLFKPNLKELSEGLGQRLDTQDLAGISAAIHRLRERMPHKMTLVTLSENGMLLIDEAGEAHHVPAHYRDIVDVSGAGDTVVSVAALCLAAGLSPVSAVEYANLAGGLVCEEVGVVPIDPEKLLRD